MSSRSNNILVEHELKIKSVAYLIIHSIFKKSKPSKKSRRWWTTYLFKQRENQTTLMTYLRFDETTGQFKNFVRMESEYFEFLLCKIGPKIMKQDTQLRKAVSVEKRLAVTLRFLATGDSFTSLQYTFLISKQLISCIIPEVCRALVEVLNEYVKVRYEIIEGLK